MPFNAKEFLRQKFQARTESVKVNDLADWFDGEPVWLVRGLTAEELAYVNEAADQAKNMTAIVEALAQGHNDKVKALEEAMGLSKKTPQDTAKRIVMLVKGSVEPECDRQLAVKLADAYPIEFYSLTGAILRLTGQGKVVPGKQSSSGLTQESEQLQPSVIKEEDSCMK